MHFLGAVIGGNNTSEAEAIIDPYSEYEEVEEYVLYTRDEFLKDNRENDRRLIEREGENQHDRMSEAFEEAERRLALNDEEALEAYAQYCGYSLNETAMWYLLSTTIRSMTGMSSAVVGRN